MLSIDSSSTTPQRVLVTGAGGFLGLYLVEQLVARGDQVRAFCRGSYPELENLGVEVVRGDLRDPAAVSAACREIDVVHHVASVAGIWGPWDHFYGINVLGTQHLLAACRQHGVSRLVYTSSPSVTFDGSEQCGVDESAPYPQTWLCHYAHTKALAEQAVLAAHDDQALRTCALRPHLIWGPRDNHLIPRLLERARLGQLRIVGNGSNRIDMIYVENAASAQIQAADALTPGSPLGGRAYFISQGEPVACWPWINEILTLAGVPPVHRRVPATVAYAAGAVLEQAYRLMGRTDEPRMTRFLAAQLSKSHYFDISRARQDFGYEPRISTAEGMARLARELRPSPRLSGEPRSAAITP
jgi:nucleoside-diphosphate-sugar epimerase